MRKAISGLDDSEFFPEESYAIGEGLTGIVFKTGQTSLENHLLANPLVSSTHIANYVEALKKEGDPKSQLTVPIRGQRGEPIGVLRALNKLDEEGLLFERGFMLEDQWMIELISDAIGMTVQIIRRAEADQVPIGDIERVSEMAHSLASSLDIDTLIQRLISVYRLREADYMDVALVDDSGAGDRLLKTSISGIPGAPPLHRRARPYLDGGYTKLAIRSGEPQRVDDVMNDPEDLRARRHSPYLLAFNIRSYAVQPLILGNHVLGAIVLYSRVPNAFAGPDMAERLASYADAVTQAINASQHGGHRRRIAPNFVRRKNNIDAMHLVQHLQTELNRISRHDLEACKEQMLEVASRLCADALSAGECSIFMIDPLRRHLEWEASSHLGSNYRTPKRSRLKKGYKCGIAVHVASTGEPLAFTGDAYTQHEAWAGPTADPISKPPLAERKSMLLVPGRDALGRICAVLKFENIDTSQIESDSLVFLPKANLHLALQLANAATAVIAPISKELEYERAHEQGLVEARQRLTVELHAALQYVAIIANTADRIRQQEGIDDVVRKTASELVAQAQKFNVDVRLSLAGASNDMLVSDGLCAALAGYVLHCGRYSDDQIIDFRSVGKPRRIHPTAEWALFMIARNAIANALKHSHVRDMRQGAIWVRIVFQDDGIVELHVEDNGCGFNPELTHAGFGLKQMRMLADEIDATLTIKNSNSDSTGTRVSVTYDVEAFNAEASA